MSAQPSTGDSPARDDTGTCDMMWDGAGWNCVGNHCVPPNICPPGNILQPGEYPGEIRTFACVYPESLSREKKAALLGALRSGVQDAPAKTTATPGAGMSGSAPEYPAVSKLNLMYHVYPNAASDAWLRNVRQLRRRLGIFNGRKVVAVATGPGLVHPDEVQSALEWPGVEYLPVPNDPEIGHTASFAGLLAAVRSKDASEATFYAHTKGAANGRLDAKAIEYWRNAMYASLLDDPDQVRNSLRRFAAVGACKKVHPQGAIFPSNLTWSRWHFSGTFFWFRHDRVFSDPHWTFIPHDYYGVETWLGGFLAAEEACSLLQPRPETEVSWFGYDRDNWTSPIPDEGTPHPVAAPRPTPVRVPAQTIPIRAVPAPQIWEGTCARKPWEYRVTAAIPAIDHAEQLAVAVELLRLQTVRPYIMVIDTGSSREQFARIEAMRAADLEVHAIRLHGARHPSDPVAHAMDLAFSMCRTPFLFATHQDCFLRRRDFLEYLLSELADGAAAAGYELSPREHADWQGMLGHTATMFDMRQMDQIGAGWSLRRLCTLRGFADQRPDLSRPNWPDTESLLNILLREHAARVKIVGREENFVRNKDENIDHCRSLPSSSFYAPGYYSQALRWYQEARAEALTRIAAWSESPIPC